MQAVRRDSRPTRDEEPGMRLTNFIVKDAILPALKTSAADVNPRDPAAVSVVKERVGDRPAASTPIDSDIIRTARAVHQALGIPFALGESSTDANVPMSLGIPALTIGTGGRGSDAHAITEAFDTTDAWQGTQRALLLVIALAK